MNVYSDIARLESDPSTTPEQLAHAKQELKLAGRDVIRIFQPREGEVDECRPLDEWFSPELVAYLREDQALVDAMSGGNVGENLDRLLVRDGILNESDVVAARPAAVMQNGSSSGGGQ